jgi:hypothetical protein
MQKQRLTDEQASPFWVRKFRDALRKRVALYAIERDSTLEFALDELLELGLAHAKKGDGRE